MSAYSYDFHNVDSFYVLPDSTLDSAFARTDDYSEWANIPLAIENFTVIDEVHEVVAIFRRIALSSGGVVVSTSQDVRTLVANQRAFLDRLVHSAHLRNEDRKTTSRNALI